MAHTKNRVLQQPLFALLSELWLDTGRNYTTYTPIPSTQILEKSA